MHLSTALSLFAVASGMSALVSSSPIQKRGINFTPLRPPAFPLAVRNMYFSQWLAQDTLYGGWSQFWTGSNLGNAGLVRVDGTTYEFLGYPTQAAIGTSKQCSQTAASYTSTHSTFTMTCGPITLKADFISPIIPTDIKRLSIPMTYVRIDVASNDGGTHDVQIYQDISGEWVHGDVTQIVNWGFQTVGNLNVFTAQPTNPTPLAEFSDHASWGQVIFATDNNIDPVTVQSGQDSVVRSQFVAHGALTNGQDTNFRAINNNWPVFAHARNFGSVTSSGKWALYVLGHVRDPAVNFIPGSKPSLWRDYFNGDWTQMLTFFWNDYFSNISTNNALDNTVANAAAAQGGQNYVAVTSLAVRQAFGATEFVGTQAQPYLMLKEISSDGNVQTVDVVYPTYPIFYFLNPELLRYLLDPIFDNVESGYWPKDFAIHDIGSHYPQAIGHQDGNEEDMPIEESANMLIMTTAYCQAAKCFDYCKQHYNTLHGWSEYLVANLPDAQNQQQTDDFTGPIAHSVNLALKGIIGIGAQAIISGAVGNSADQMHFGGVAASYINTWATDSQDPSGQHLKLAYDQNGTWSLAYNAFSDLLLGTNLVSPSIISEQDAFYQTVASAPYGIKLDSRTNNWSKCDWELFTAAASKSSQVKQHFINTLASWLANTGGRVPFGDLFDTVSGNNDGFRARPVVGGTFAVIAAATKSSTTTGVTSGATYKVQISGGRSGCNTYLSTVACGTVTNPNLVDMFTNDDGSGHQRWQFNVISGKSNTYNIVNTGRSGCNDYLSAIACGSSTANLVDIYNADDGSGRQQWLLTPVPGKTLTFEVQNVGRSGCNPLLSCASCGSNLVDLFSTDDGSGRQQWTLIPA